MEEKKPELKLDRRSALKLIAAAGGSIVASTLLPGKWSKPELQAGVLPAHAQTSQPVTRYSILSSTEQVDAEDNIYIFLAVNITPAAAGIAMRASYQVTTMDLNAVAPVETLEALTDATGLAEFDRFEILWNTTRIDITYSFVDAAVCDVNCTLQKVMEPEAPR